MYGQNRSRMGLRHPHAAHQQLQVCHYDFKTDPKKMKFMEGQNAACQQLQVDERFYDVGTASTPPLCRLHIHKHQAL